MIPIPKNLLNCAAYIYKSKPDADAGARSGGSVFFVGVELEVNKEYKYFYGVSDLPRFSQPKIAGVSRFWFEGEYSSPPSSSGLWGCGKRSLLSTSP